jgi:hypothetical protein
MSDLVVSGNGRFLVNKNGAPFFYLADTAWELIHRLTREDAEIYLSCRASQGFTVIHTVLLAEFAGLTAPNAYGDLPLIEMDPERPVQDYFLHADWVIDRAAAHGIIVGLLPTWGDKVPGSGWGDGPIVFTPENAFRYGKFLGSRYRDKSVLWIIGGDRPVESSEARIVWESLARGIKAAGAEQLMLFHPPGGKSSSDYFYDADWLDANMTQSGHTGFTPNYRMIQEDYSLTPMKPCMDGEPCYENHPVMSPQWTPTSEWFGEYESRRAAYWSLFSGSHGHTYGCHDVWQFLDGSREAVNAARTPWKKAVQLPAASQMRHARALMLSRPFLSRIPDHELIESSLANDQSYVAATRAVDGSYAFIYSPDGNPFVVNLSLLSGDCLQFRWFDPRTGTPTTPIELDRRSTIFTPPQDDGPDWVLVIDDKSQNFPAPGAFFDQPKQ